jgi:hypothetical protein
MKSVDVSERDTWMSKAKLQCRTYASVSRLLIFGGRYLEVVLVVPQVEDYNVKLPHF